jgi:hypothetical protein
VVDNTSYEIADANPGEGITVSRRISDNPDGTYDIVVTTRTSLTRDFALDGTPNSEGTASQLWVSTLSALSRDYTRIQDGVTDDTTLQKFDTSVADAGTADQGEIWNRRLEYKDDCSRRAVTTRQTSIPTTGPAWGTLTDRGGSAPFTAFKHLTSLPDPSPSATQTASGSYYIEEDNTYSGGYRLNNGNAGAGWTTGNWKQVFYRGAYNDSNHQVWKEVTYHSTHSAAVSRINAALVASNFHVAEPQVLSMGGGSWMAIRYTWLEEALP